MTRTIGVPHSSRLYAMGGHLQSEPPGAPYLDFVMWASRDAQPLSLTASNRTPTHLLVSTPVSLSTTLRANGPTTYQPGPKAQGDLPSSVFAYKSKERDKLLPEGNQRLQLSEYLDTRFPQLSLTPPLFYNWPVGIRFDLHPDEKDDLDRARTLYEYVFRRHDLALIVSGVTHYHDRVHPNLSRTAFSSGRHWRRFPSVFQLSKRNSLGLRGIAGRQKINTYEDEDTNEITTYRWTEIKPIEIEYNFILRAIANTRSGIRSPRLDERIYFINRTRNIIFHMYDDRGVDIIAPQATDLRGLYETHKDWILDYDRERIENTFSPSQTAS